MTVEVLCTRCMTRFDGLDQFTVHCRATHPADAEQIAEIAALAEEVSS